ncbi:MAG: bifunctional acetate--CoA ligase family protein/GNAT family N-acetyltransferase [Pirellulales bacterium]|nr:bifunctional acetate--CoA ligase family protein/GNAT family N-acetyltransferase [Pirellulales bacterium]
MPPTAVARMLTPRSVAVVGASNTASKVGAITFRNLVQGGFEGPVYPVNSQHGVVQGTKAYRSLAELPGPVDLVVVCTPAATVPAIVRQAGEAGVGGLIILTAGFREKGSAGHALEESLKQELRRFPELRAIGPNCLGAIVPAAKLNASFAASMPLPGRVAFVSQSGALCTAMLDWARERRLGFSCFVSIGNMLDVDFADLLDYLAEDPQTEAVILYLESITNARQFMSAARACARRKPILAYKAGRFALSAQAAASHTGAMAGVDAVYDAAFERAGIVRVLRLDDLFDCAQLLAGRSRLSGERLAIVTNAGGPGVIACDALLAAGGTLASLHETTLKRLDEALPACWSHGNPVDVLGDASPERFGRALEIVAHDDHVDAVLAILTPQAMSDPTATAAALVEVAARTAEPLLACWMGGDLVQAGVEILNAAGVPTVATPDDAVSAFMQLVRHKKNLELLYELPREIPVEFADLSQRKREQLHELFQTERELLYESEAKTLLAAYGVPVAEVRKAQTVDGAVALSRSMGFPVVLKVVSPQITHKTDVGGVELNLANEQQVRTAYERIVSRVTGARPDAEITGISVQPMVSLPGGIELILGAKKDPVFGPVIMVGCGGIAAELFHDRALGLPPLNERLALRMLESLQVWPLLTGYRGRKPVAHVNRLIETLLRFSALVADFPEISELDANPVLVRDDQVIVLDARIAIDRAAVERPAPPFAHLAIRPYPSDLSEQHTLPDGTAIVLRPIKPEDEPLWHELLASCSADSLRARFRFMFRTDTHEAAIRFCFVDYDRELTVVAETQLDGQRRLLGVARLVSEVGRPRGEFAVLVGDAWQGRGLGTLLTDYCVRHADRVGVEEIYAITGRENQRMVKIFKSQGFDVVADVDPTVFRAIRRRGDQAAAAN